MPIRFKLHGIDIEADSASEAMAMLSKATPSHNGTSHKAQVDIGGKQIPLGDHAKTMLKRLLDKPHGENTASMASALGVKGPKGLAGIRRQIKAWAGQKFDLAPDRCVTKLGRQLRISPELAGKLKGHEREYLN